MNVDPGWTWPLSQSGPVIVCAVDPLFVHVTVVPTGTVTVDGLNEKSIIDTFELLVEGVVDGVLFGDVGVVVVDLLLQPATSATDSANTASTRTGIHLFLTTAPFSLNRLALWPF